MEGKANGMKEITESLLVGWIETVIPEGKEGEPTHSETLPARVHTRKLD